MGSSEAFGGVYELLGFWSGECAEAEPVLAFLASYGLPEQVVEERTWTLCGTPECALGKAASMRIWSQCQVPGSRDDPVQGSW